jgi:hypothetical protein
MLEGESLEVTESSSGSNPVESDAGPQSTIEVESNEKPSGDEGKKKKGGFQKRIEKQIKKIGKLAAERDLLAQQLEEFKRGGQASAQQQAIVPVQELQKPNPDNFETLQEYNDAYADWKWEVKERERTVKAQQEEAKRAAQTQLSKHQQRLEEYKKNNSGVAKDLSKFEQMQHAAAAIDFIVESDHGPEIMAELARVPDEYEKIRKMSYSRATKEMAKFELKFEVKPPENNLNQSPDVLKNPKPINPIRSQGSTSTKSVYEADDYETYTRLRDEQFKNSLRR